MNYALALSHLVPDAQWAMDNNDYDNIQWFSEDMDKPSKLELDNAASEIDTQAQAKVDARQSALAKLAALGLTQEEIEAL
jgi:hypothetical protein